MMLSSSEPSSGQTRAGKPACKMLACGTPGKILRDSQSHGRCRPQHEGHRGSTPKGGRHQQEHHHQNHHSNRGRPARDPRRRRRRECGGQPGSLPKQSQHPVLPPPPRCQEWWERPPRRWHRRRWRPTSGSHAQPETQEPTTSVSASRMRSA
jgi:hypothetical protein